MAVGGQRDDPLTKEQEVHRVPTHDLHLLQSSKCEPRTNGASGCHISLKGLTKLTC